MYFFDNFVEKLEKESGEIKKHYKFSLSLRKKLFWILIGITMIMIGIYGGLVKYSEGNYIFMMIFIGILGYGVFAMIYNISSYKLELDLEKGILIYQNSEVKLEEIDKAVLRPMLIGTKKKLVLCIELYTKDDTKYIFPLYMAKKVRFAYILKKVFGENFIIEKEI